MKIRIEQAALQKALTRVTGVVARKGTIPILSNVLIDAETGAADRRIWLVGTDLDIEARVSVDADIEIPGQITVPGGLLDSIARSASAGAQVMIAYDRGDDPRARVSFGRNDYHLPTLAAGDFPVWGQREWREPIRVGAVDLGLILERTAFAISREQTRTYLLGASLHVVEDGGRRVLRSAATDGHRMSYAQCEALIPAEAVASCIVPAKTVAEFRRALDGRAGPVDLYLTPTGVRLEADDLILCSKVIEGDFVDYNRIIPRDWTHEITVTRADLAQAARRTSVVATDRVPAVSLSFDQEQIRITCRNMEMGQAREEIASDFAGDAFEVGLNARYLQEALNQTQADRIILRLVDGASPFRLEPEPADAEHGAALSVIVPMRI